MNQESNGEPPMKTGADSRWEASWIWGGTEASPRNVWRCFRRTFTAPGEGWDEALLSITADSRYVCYVNGTRIGRGPVRCWTFEQRYDTYAVGHLLKAGEINTIAVLVMHYGVATFSYTLGRGGLLAQLDWREQEGPAELPSLGTDDAWTTALHRGYDVRSPRMSCQLGFAERVDARLWDEQWTHKEFDKQATEWPQAVIIGPPGTSPWSQIKPRDIPLLTEEAMWPVRVESLKRVQTPQWTTHIDVRNAMVPDSIAHANHAAYVGYLVTVIHAAEAGRAVLGSPNAGSNFGRVAVNGRIIGKDECTGVWPERYVSIELKQGQNLLWIDVSGIDHGRGLELGLDSRTAFQVISPWGERAGESAFLRVGPFAVNEFIDHQEDRSPLRHYKGFSLREKEKAMREALDAEAFEQYEVYKAFEHAASVEQLSAFTPWLKPVEEGLVSGNSVFGLCVWKPAAESFPVPHGLHNAVIANSEPALVPAFTNGDTELIVDFGKELSGYLQFELDAPEGTILDWYGFEYMRDDYRQDTFDLDNTLRYVCKKGRQTYTSPVRRGLRYLMITVRGACRPVKLYGIQLLQSSYPVAEIGRFYCSDPLLNDIWDMSKHTTRLCMEDTFVDCPAYEQTFWVGDSRNEALVNYYVFGAAEIVKRCLRLVPGSGAQTPLYMDQVPSGWNSVIPNWTFFWAVACTEYVRYTGDRAFANEIRPFVQSTLNHYLQHLDDEGLFRFRGWNLLDWAPIDQPNDGVVTHQNAILVKTLREASQLSRLAGDAAGGAELQDAADRLKDAINEHLWQEEKQAYIDCIHQDGRRSGTISMQTQTAAYWCGIAEGERRERLRHYLLQPPAEFVQIGSPFMSFFYYEALADLGAIELMLEDIRTHYGEMVRYEASTCWEMYAGSSVNRANPHMLTRSHCHAWSAAPGYVLGAYILGVRPADDGWTEVLVAPEAAGLQWARGSVPLPRGGRVDVSWEVLGTGADREMSLSVCAPRGVQLDIRLPAGMKGTVEQKEV
ncbi:family 78 glycoside hydrolase catalytic domain [Paenibacillus caseinilyticus]|uniref:Alpha-L-rhamnosidase n=1 Tax=Paenibacillus mucilaginosus K02 TaxID=997761 RepID=I0BKR7_9BACL|nr:family 78 glycoside hydrolase catalytic domain [Paenibacillus mucilaginosus]AFH62964.1 alpha-L-rhamnosidase [Paenibacillus mucilaginosus K02]